MKRIIAGRLYALSLLVTIIFSGSPAVMAGDLLLIDKLIKEKNYQEAYLQATQLQAEFSGQANFDFLYAIAAIESGHPHHAIFSLERLVHEFPDNGRIKVELARAHFLAGDFKTAESIFSGVLETTPPEKVAQKIKIYLNLIEARSIAHQNKLSASVKVTGGWDSNYNSAPDLSIIQIGGLNFTLNENSRQQDTGYTGFEANLNYQQPVHKKLLLSYGAYYQQRQNVGNELDTQTFGLFIAPLIATSNSQIRFPLQFQQLDLDGSNYRQYGSVGAEWMPSLKNTSQWTHFIQYGLIRYADQPVRDMNLAVIGTSYNVTSKKGNHYQTAIFYNDESSEKSQGEHNEVDTLGLRSLIKWPFTVKHSLYSKITLQTLEYGKTHPVFNMLREDQNFSAALGWEIKLNPVTVFTAEAEYSENSSNIDVYDYDRSSAFISLRYLFI